MAELGLAQPQLVYKFIIYWAVRLSGTAPIIELGRPVSPKWVIFLVIWLVSYLKGLNSDWSTIKTYWACSVKLISCQDTHFNALLNINTFSFHIEFRIFKGQKSLNIYARRNHKPFEFSRGTIRQFHTRQVKWFPAYALNLWFFSQTFSFQMALTEHKRWFIIDCVYIRRILR